MGHFHGGVVHHHAEVVGGHADVARASPVRAMIQSSRLSAGKRVSPLMRSGTTMSPSSGMRNRMAAGWLASWSASAQPFPRSRPRLYWKTLPAVSTVFRRSSMVSGSSGSGRPGPCRAVPGSWPGRDPCAASGGRDHGGPSSFRVAHHGALVPVQAAPGHAVLDDADVVVRAAGEVRVLDAQDEAPPVPAGEEPAEQGRPHSADVEHAGGRGGKAGDDLAGHEGPRIQSSGVPKLSAAISELTKARPKAPTFASEARSLLNIQLQSDLHRRIAAEEAAIQDNGNFHHASVVEVPVVLDRSLFSGESPVEIRLKLYIK